MSRPPQRGAEIRWSPPPRSLSPPPRSLSPPPGLVRRRKSSRSTSPDPESSDPTSLSFSLSDLPLPIYHPDADVAPPPDDQHWRPPKPVPRSRVMPPPSGHPIQQETTSENARLREQISQLQQQLEKAQVKQEKYVQKSYEARVAVMGFKCRQMQLQGEVEHLRGMVNKPSETELQIQLEKMKIEKITHDHDRENLLSVIDKLKEDMEGMRGQDRSEMQRLQQVVWELQQENAALKSRQEHQQQELQAQSEKMATEKIAQDREQRNLLTVIGTLQTDIQSLEGMHGQDRSEMQRLQQVVRELQQENAALKSRRQQPPSTRDEQRHLWVVRREEIHLTPRELGRGGWAVVQVAEFRGLQVAAKCLHHAIISSYNRHLFVREMNIASSLRHPNLVQFIGATIEGQPIILTELMESCLRTILESRPLNPAQITSISIDVARALNYLHLMHPDPLIHRDVSSANVLLDRLQNKGWRAKVADYGSVNYLQHLKTVGPGNPTYAAPEADAPKLQSPKMDVFSYGVLLLEMCSRKFPSAEEREEFLQRVQEPAMLALIQQCLEHEPQRRPTMNKILEHLNKLLY